MGIRNGPHHKWRGLDDEQTCDACPARRVRIANSRQKPGKPRGYHWEYWHNGMLGPNAGPCQPEDSTHAR